jgi:hypothetical protein
MKKIFFAFLFTALCLTWSCRKGPTDDLLQGIWKEQDGGQSKLIFNGDTLFVFHEPEIDTTIYALDEKHGTIWSVPMDSSSGGKSYQVEWHKRKKILVVLGLFPSGLGNVSKSYFRK